MVRGALTSHATTTMRMDVYGHLFSEAPSVAMERMPRLSGSGPHPGWRAQGEVATDR